MIGPEKTLAISYDSRLTPVRDVTALQQEIESIGFQAVRLPDAANVVDYTAETRPADYWTYAERANQHSERSEAFLQRLGILAESQAGLVIINTAGTSEREQPFGLRQDVRSINFLWAAGLLPSRHITAALHGAAALDRASHEQRITVNLHGDIDQLRAYAMQEQAATGGTEATV